MSQHMIFGREKRNVIDAQRHLDETRDAELDAWDVFALAMKADALTREQATDTLAEAKLHYEAAAISYADALLAYKNWTDDQRVMLTLTHSPAQLAS